MEVVSCNKEFNSNPLGKGYLNKTRGYTIKHNQPIGWMGTTSEYIGWYRYKKDAINRKKELEKSLVN